MNRIDKTRLRKMGILSVALMLATNSIISGGLIKMKDDLGISLSTAEFLVPLSSIATVIFILLSEPITKKIGIKSCVSLGLFLVGLAGILPIISKSLPLVFISRLLLGSGIGLFNGHSASLINIFYEGDEASRLHGLRNSMEFMGQMVLLFISGILIRISWQLAFLSYTLAFILLIFFKRTVEDVRVKVSEERFRINIQTVFFMVFAGVMIMNTTAISIRFPLIATRSLGDGANINMYMLILPISGMVTGFFFGAINKRLRSKTILLGLITYLLANGLLGLLGENVYIYLLSMFILAFSQSLCTPYIFVEIARFTRSSSSRMVNNLIFVGCNLGGFLGGVYLNFIGRVFSIDSPTLAFLSFILIYGVFFLVFAYEYFSVRFARYRKY